MDTVQAMVHCWELAWYCILLPRDAMLAPYIIIISPGVRLFVRRVNHKSEIHNGCVVTKTTPRDSPSFRMTKVPDFDWRHKDCLSLKGLSHVTVQNAPRRSLDNSLLRLRSRRMPHRDATQRNATQSVGRLSAYSVCLITAVTRVELRRIAVRRLVRTNLGWNLEQNLYHRISFKLNLHRL